MFKNISFDLEHPICACQKFNLGWGFWREDDKNFGINIFCRSCNVKNTIPASSINGHFRFLKEKYKDMSDDERPLPDNVIPFRRK